MTREQAKIYAKLSREDIEKIDKGYAEHYDVICAFAAGKEIEVRYTDDDDWRDSGEDPDFFDELKLQYRVKPCEAKQAEPWKPKDDEKFFCVCGNGEVCSVAFDENFEADKEYLDFGNCFRTREEAEAARERVRAALKGETVSKTETIENKSHVVGLSEKLGEPSIAVFHCDGKGGEGGAILRGRGAAVELDGDKERVLTGLVFLFVSLFRRGFKAGTLEKVLEISTKHFYERGKKIKVEKIEL